MQVWAGSMDGKVYVYDIAQSGGLSNVRTLSHDSLKSGVRALLDANTHVFAGAEDGKICVFSKTDENATASTGSAHKNIVGALCNVGGLVRKD